MNTYNIFISHAWKYGDEYNRLVKLLKNNKSNFTFKNYSAPEEKPLVLSKSCVSKEELEEDLDSKIRPSSAVLVIAGMYYNNREWMHYELNTAQRMHKPIIAIKPWRHTHVPHEIHNIATTIVAWRTDSIVQAIRNYAI